MPDEEWCALVISRSLQSNHIEVRDAAIQAVEAWDNKRVIEELKKHTEQIPWLKNYVDRVLSIN